MVDFISFDALESHAGDAAGRAVLRLLSHGYGDGIEEGSAICEVMIRLGTFGYGQLSSGAGTPEVPASGGASLLLRTEAEGYRHQYDEGECRLVLTLQGYGAAPGYGVASTTLEVRSGGTSSLTEQDGYALLEAMPFRMSITASDVEAATASDTLVLGSPASSLPTNVVRELLVMARSPSGHFDGAVTADDTLHLGDQVTPVVLMLAQDTIVLNAIAAGDHVAFVRVVERLLLTGQAGGLAEAVAIITDALVLGAMVDALQVGYSQDTLLLSDTVDSLYEVIGAVIERLLLGGTATPHYLAMALVRDTLLLGDGALHEADLTALVRDAVGFAANIRLDNGEYIAWVMNTESKGLTRYTNYPFNSFAKIGGRYVGCSPQGLHWLDGDTDDGEQISARMRLGVDDMGTRRLKNIPDAYIGYTSDGVLLLRAIYTDEASGEKVAATYRLSPRAASAKREHRFKLGRGLKAVDWDFEIENVDGSDFELSNVEFRPLVLDRRTRG